MVYSCSNKYIGILVLTVMHNMISILLHTASNIITIIVQYIKCFRSCSTENHLIDVITVTASFAHSPLWPAGPSAHCMCQVQNIDSANPILLQLYCSLAETNRICPKPKFIISAISPRKAPNKFPHKINQLRCFLVCNITPLQHQELSPSLFICFHCTIWSSNTEITNFGKVNCICMNWKLKVWQGYVKKNCHLAVLWLLYLKLKVDLTGMCYCAKELVI